MVHHLAVLQKYPYAIMCIPCRFSFYLSASYVRKTVEYKFPVYKVMLKDKVYAIKFAGVGDLKKQIRDVITTINRDVQGHTWEEVSVFRATHGAHIDVY